MLVSERAGLPLTNGQWSKSDSIKISVCACVSLLCSKCLFSLSLGHVKSLLSACLLRKKISSFHTLK